MTLPFLPRLPHLLGQTRRHLARLPLPLGEAVLLAMIIAVLVLAWPG